MSQDGIKVVHVNVLKGKKMEKKPKTIRTILTTAMTGP